MTKALIVDNNPVLLRAITALLEQEGCEVRTASNGLEALNLLKESVPDIVFTDLVMPLVSGEQLCRIIRHTPTLAHIYLVVISAISVEDQKKVLAENSCDLLIAKGTLQELRVALQDALQRQAAFSKDMSVTRSVLESNVPQSLATQPVTGELLAAKRHLQRILENLEEGIVELDISGVIISLNSTAQKMLLRREEELIGTAFAEYPWGDYTVKIRQWLEDQSAIGRREILAIREDRPLGIGDRVLTLSCIPVRDEGVPFTICILRDITRQHLAEQHERELNQAVRLITKMEAMSGMAGGIAHDFNNLLTVICGNLDMLLHKEAHSENGDRYHNSLVEQARSAAYVAVDLTRKISFTSPFGIVNRREMVLEDLVAGVVDVFSAEHGAEIVLTGDHHRSLVKVDPEQVATVLTNLLKNGLEAGGQGSLEARVSDIDLESPVILAGQYVPAGQYVLLRVTDHGIGISPDNLLKVFDPYYSTRIRGAAKGMGLGLTMVYSTLRNHGGYVVITSAPGDGTTVSCYLPRYDQGAGARQPKSRVLLIDSDPQVREAGEIMLKHLGYQGESVATIDGAQDLLAGESVGGDKGSWLVLVDVAQQQVDDHRQVTARLRKSGHVRDIIITGSGVLDPVMRNYRRFGYANVLPKPYSLDSLRHILAGVERNH